MRHIAIGVLLIRTLAGAAPAQAMVIATRGTAADCTVVLPAETTPVLNYAARELTNYVARTTGVLLPIVKDTAALPARAILIGPTAHTASVLGETPDLAKLGTDGFRIAVRGERLMVLASATRGALYGVYEVLEKFASCRWYASWCEITPNLQTLTIPTGYDDTQVPALPHRQPFWYDVIQNPDFGARLRANADNLSDRHGGVVARFGKGLGNCHTFVTLLPPSQYAATHPEYYALRPDGTRACGTTSAVYTSQPCLTNPDVLRIVTSNVLACIRRDPTAQYYGVSQNDNTNYCVCAACQAVDDAEGSHAGTVLRFVNAVADEVAKTYPDKIIETLAYRYSRTPPALTRCRDNVMPCLCSIECDFSRPLDQSPYPHNVSFVTDLTGWAAICKRLYVWDYTTDFNYYPQPMANVYALQGNVRLFRDIGVQALFAQGDRQGAHGGFAELKAWLLAKFMWNPDQPLEPLLQDFFTGYYGAGAPYVRQFFDEVHAAQLAYSQADVMHALRCEPSELAPGVSDEVFENGARLIDQAMTAVTGDALRELNVRTVRFSIDFARLVRLNGALLRINLDQSERNVEALADARRELAVRACTFFDERADIRLCSSETREKKWLSEWRNQTNSTHVVTSTNGIIEDVFFTTDGLGTWTQREADEQALDGFAVRNFNVRNGWSTRIQMSDIRFASNLQYKVSIRARLASRIEGRDGAAFSAGIYSNLTKNNLVGTYRRASKMSLDYEWYDLGTMEVPDKTAYFYFAAGARDADGQPHAGDVLIDCLRIQPVTADGHDGFVRHLERDASNGNNPGSSLSVGKGATKWSDGLDQHALSHYIVGTVEKDQLMVCTDTKTTNFTGASLTMCNKATLALCGRWPLHVADVTFYGGSTMVSYGSAGVSSGIAGCIPRFRTTYGSEAAVCATPKGGLTIAFEQGIAGDADLHVCVLDATDKSAVVRIDAPSPDYSGAIAVMARNDRDTVPTRAVLSIADARALGGPRAAFTRDALVLYGGQALEATDTTTFDEPTRGLSFKTRNNGVPADFIVAPGKTATVLQPLCFHGELRKCGAGTLAIGGTNRIAFAESEDGYTPHVNSNVLTIVEGDLKVLSTNAVDGLAITFESGTCLTLDLDTPDPAVRAYGLYNTKWQAAPLSAENNRLEVAFTADESYELTPACARLAICTVPASYTGLTCASFALRPFRGNVPRIRMQVNPATKTKTFYADFIPRGLYLRLD